MIDDQAPGRRIYNVGPHKSRTYADTMATPGQTRFNQNFDASPKNNYYSNRGTHQQHPSFGATQPGLGAEMHSNTMRGGIGSAHKDRGASQLQNLVNGINQENKMTRSLQANLLGASATSLHSANNHSRDQIN
jgi:hypothetical protein